MGSVWVADHLGLQSQVAVKFMTPAQLEDETSVQRFRQEARAAAEIRSPHVVQVFDHGFTAEGLPYIVMELLEGESLDKRVKRLGSLSATAWFIAMRILARSHSPSSGIAPKSTTESVCLTEKSRGGGFRSGSRAGATSVRA